MHHTDNRDIDNRSSSGLVLVAMCAGELGRALNGSVVTLDGARDNWFGPWPPPTLAGDGGEVPTEARRPG